MLQKEFKFNFLNDSFNKTMTTSEHKEKKTMGKKKTEL